MKITVLMGGLSPERNVSISSGTLIAAALRRRGHRVLLADVYEGVDLENADVEKLFTTDSSTNASVSEHLPDIEELIARNGGRTDPVGNGIFEVCLAADVVFLALHGDVGENGQLQAMLGLYGIPYTGSDHVGSMLAMDKDIAKKLLRNDGILTPDWIRIDTHDCTAAETAASVIGFPMVIKPCSCGSSVGVFIVDDAEGLRSAIVEAGKYERHVMAEKKISGRELTCAYFDGETLPPVEIIPKTGFYDYKNKYQANAAEEICPAPIGDTATAAVAEATKKGFAALRLRGYARFDFILDNNDQAWCLEANTLPGMTPTSLLPQEAAAAGITYDELCERIALLAMKK